MNRMDKVNSELKRRISEIIDKELTNQSLQGGLVTVTGVETTPNFAQAKVFVSMIAIKNRKEAMKTLKRASGYIRSRVASKASFRVMPKLIFMFDESIEYGTHINKLIKDIKEDNDINDDNSKENSDVNNNISDSSED